MSRLQRRLLIGSCVLGIAWMLVSVIGSVQRTAAVVERVEENVEAEYRALTEDVDKAQIGEDAADGLRDIGGAFKDRVLQELEK